MESNIEDLKITTPTTKNQKPHSKKKLQTLARESQEHEKVIEAYNYKNEDNLNDDKVEGVNSLNLNVKVKNTDAKVKETSEPFKSLTYLEFQLNDARKLCIKDLPFGITKKELMALSTQIKQVKICNMVAILEFQNEEIAHKKLQSYSRKKDLRK